MDINELRGLLEPSAQDRQDALSMGLLGLGSGLLANSTGHYGQFAPAMGRGMQGGLQGYQTGMQNARENRMQDIGLRLKLAEMQKRQAEEQRMQGVRSTLTPEQQRMLDLGVSAEKVMIPEQPKVPPIVQEMRAAGIDENSPQGRQMLHQRLIKETTHAPAATMKTVVNPAIDPFKNEKSLRDEYQALPQVKSAAEMNNAFRMIETAYQKPSAANDLAMATKYMKILDPTSVVRESEFAMAVNATGLMDKVYNYANAVKTGQRLNPAQRKDFYDSAKAINDAFQSEAVNSGGKYKGIASQYGLNPENITIGTEFSKPSKTIDFGSLK